VLSDGGTRLIVTVCAQVRTDLVDCGIYICEPDVLALFSDNWDYQARAPLHAYGQRAAASSVWASEAAARPSRAAPCLLGGSQTCAGALQNLRRDFMTGILSEEELGGKHLYVHELRRGCHPFL